MKATKDIIATIKTNDFSETIVEQIIIKQIESDRKRLLKALSDETMYEYDDIFRKVKIELT